VFAHVAANRSSTLELELADSTVVSQVSVDIVNDATVVAEQDTIAVGLFTSLLGGILGSDGLPVDAIKMRIERIDFHDEAIEIFFRKEVVVI